MQIPNLVSSVSHANTHSKGIPHDQTAGRSWEEVTPVAHWAARYEHAALARAPGEH